MQRTCACCDSTHYFWKNLYQQKMSNKICILKKCVVSIFFCPSNQFSHWNNLTWTGRQGVRSTLRSFFFLFHLYWVFCPTFKWSSCDPRQLIDDNKTRKKATTTKWKMIFAAIRSYALSSLQRAKYNNNNKTARNEATIIITNHKTYQTRIAMQLPSI